MDRVGGTCRDKPCCALSGAAGILCAAIEAKWSDAVRAFVVPPAVMEGRSGGPAWLR